MSLKEYSDLDLGLLLHQYNGQKDKIDRTIEAILKELLIRQEQAKIAAGLDKPKEPASV